MDLIVYSNKLYSTISVRRRRLLQLCKLQYKFKSVLLFTNIYMESNYSKMRMSRTSYVQYINSSAVCLPIGRCTEKYQCTTAGSNSDGVQQIVIGNWNQLQCVNGGFTAQIPFSSCVCNYGYNGGYFIPCVCPSEIQRCILQ